MTERIITPSIALIVMLSVAFSYCFAECRGAFLAEPLGLRAAQQCEYSDCHRHHNSKKALQM